MPYVNPNIRKRIEIPEGVSFIKVPIHASTELEAMKVALTLDVIGGILEPIYVPSTPYVVDGVMRWSVPQLIYTRAEEL